MPLYTSKTTKTMSEQRFLDHIYDGYQAGQRYCFVLGAGASKASGIRTGEEMMREWRQYLWDKGSDYIQDCARELGLEEKNYLHIFNKDYSLANDDYFTLFDLRFAGEPNVAYAYLEKEMEGKYPSYGYFPLAMLLSNTENRLVITTNFDTLLEDALYTYTFKHPLVVGHESLASYIGSDARHPVIAKIHRDLLFRPFNRKEDMDKLKDEWEQPLRNALSRYIPIVIGYAGGDHTFMSLLQKIELNGIYWCHLGDMPQESICDTVARHNGYMVKILGFDEIMFRLGDRFAEEANFGNPCQYIQDQAKKRCSLYQENLDNVKKKYKTQKPGPENVPGDTGDKGDVVGLIDAIERYDNRQSDREEADSVVSKLESEAWKKLTLGENEAAQELYTKLIELNPNKAEYYDWRSTALHMMKQYDKAIQDDTMALELEPDNAVFYNSRAVSLHDMGQLEQALHDQTKAIELNPNNAVYYHSRAITLHALKQYEQALQDRTKAIELDSLNARYYEQRGLTLHAMGQYEQALQDMAKAIEMEPNNALYYHGRASILNTMKEYNRELQDRTKAIELDPECANYYYCRAVSFYNMGDYDKAIQDDNRAIELNPTNAEFYNSRALTLHQLNREEEALKDEAKAKELEKTGKQ